MTKSMTRKGEVMRTRTRTGTRTMNQVAPPWKTRWKIYLARRTTATTARPGLRVLSLVGRDDAWMLLL